MNTPLAEARIVVTTDTGKLAVLRASDGLELAETDSGGEGGIIDLTYDPTQSMLFSYEENDEGEGAEIGLYPLTLAGAAASFGPRTRLAWVDGVARIMALPEGLVSFQENIGQRWAIRRADGKPTPSIACPRPASLVIDRAAKPPTIVALSAPFPSEDTAQRIEVALTDVGLGPCKATAIAGVPSRARLLQLANGAELVVGIDNQKLSIAPIGQVAAPLSGPLDVTATTVELATVIDGALGRVAVLMSGPARLAVFDVSVDQGSMTFQRAAAITLPGEVRREDQFFSRDMTNVDNRIFIATDLGVVAVDITDAQSTLALQPIAFPTPSTGDTNPYRGPIVSLTR